MGAVCQKHAMIMCVHLDNDDRKIVNVIEYKSHSMIDSMMLPIDPGDSSSMMIHLTSQLRNMLSYYHSLSLIKDFNCSVDYVPKGKQLKEVNCLPSGTLPGDSWTVGSAGKNRYDGIVVSSDGTGSGVVFQNVLHDAIHVKIDVRVKSTIDSIVIEFAREL